MSSYVAEVEERIGSLRTWPHFILQIIFTAEYNYKNRLLICSFFALNYIDEVLLINFLREASYYRVFKEDKIRGVHRWLLQPGIDGDSIRRRYYSIDLVSNRVCYLNGDQKSVWIGSGKLGNGQKS
jgi:hypothetical protein